MIIKNIQNKMLFYNLYQTHPKINLNKNHKDTFLSFKNNIYDGYSSFEIKLAEKYIYCANCYEPLTDEIWENIPVSYRIFHKSSANRKMLHQYYRISNLMGKIIAERKKQEQQIKTNNDLIASKDADINNITKELVNLKKNLEAQNIETEKRQEELNELTFEERKWNYFIDNLQNGVVDLVKADRENRKKDSEDKLIELQELNGVMLKGLSDEKEEKIINWLKSSTGCDVVELDFGKKNKDESLKELLRIVKNASQKEEKTFLHIKNLEKVGAPTEENEKNIGKYKNLFQCISKKYNCIMITKIENPEKIDEDLLAEHRFVIKLDSNHVKNDKKMELIQNHDGYKLNIDTTCSRNIMLYLGDSGYNDRILWIDTSKNEDIIAVLARLNKIKMIDKFKNITKIQCPKPNTPEELPSFNRLWDKYTYTGIPIYEKSLY